MRIAAFLFALAILPSLHAQQQTAAAAIQNALLGQWSGYLEYRDYSEPPTSTRRVQLPTWLSIQPAPNGALTLHYIYDDGPAKIIDSTETLTLDPTSATYTTAEPGHAAQIFSIAGASTLHEGHGTLTLTGSGTDNHKSADQRITLTIRRNLLEWLLESRPSGTAEPFAFRHLYRFTRAHPPTLSPPAK